MAVPDVHAVASIIPEYMQRSVPHEFFNRMQSNCLEAWDSDHNLLVSAPTGSGKTVCFELAILRHLHKCLEGNGTKRLDSGGLTGKIVFIAPTKALCAEKELEWKRKFGYLGLRVEMITGDVTLARSDPKLSNADLILSTAEKWDAITRNLGSQSVLDLSSQVSLLLLDEVHQLGDSRGAAFELVVTRMLMTSDECKRQAGVFDADFPSASLRIVAVSATIRNAADVGTWLRVPPDYIKVFDQSFRPIALEFKVLGYHLRNQWQSGKVFDAQILDVLGRFAAGKPALVFSPSRRQSMLSAEYVVGTLQLPNQDLISNGNALTCHLTVEQRRALKAHAEECDDKRLAALLASGVAVHNADMSAKSRRTVEELFRKSLILCLFSTSTLAQGVNLPARIVLIAGTAIYKNGALQEYDKNLLLQMCGRAGRAGLDSKGIAVIMTSKSAARRYQNMDNVRPSRIESQLQAGLEDSLNAEVARQFVTDMPTALLFLTNTYYAVLQVRHADDSDSEKRKLRETAIAKVNALSSLGLIRFDEDGFGICSTATGVSMAKYCVSFAAMRMLITNVPTALSPAQVLRIIATCPEILEGVCVRRSEKRKLNELNGMIRLPVRGKVKEPADKIVVLLQVIMGDLVNSFGTEFALRSEALRLIETASRISSCLLALVLDQSIDTPYEALFAVLQTCRAVLCQTYWDGPTLLRQISGIDRSTSRAFVNAGLPTIEHLCRTNARDIDAALRSASDKGKMVLRGLQEIPQFRIDAALRQDSQEGLNALSMEVRLTLLTQVGSRKLLQRKMGRGFVLIGSHAIGLIAVRTFRLEDAKEGLSFAVNFRKPGHSDKWVDIVAGSDSFLGVDAKRRLNLFTEFEKPATYQKMSPQPPCQTSEQHPKRKHAPFVTSERVSKRQKRRRNLSTQPTNSITHPGSYSAREGTAVATVGNDSAADEQYGALKRTSVDPDQDKCETRALSTPQQYKSYSRNGNDLETNGERSDTEDDAETQLSLDQNANSNAIVDSSQSDRQIQSIARSSVTKEYDDILRNLF